MRKYIVVMLALLIANASYSEEIPSTQYYVSIVGASVPDMVNAPSNVQFGWKNSSHSDIYIGAALRHNDTKGQYYDGTQTHIRVYSGYRVRISEKPGKPFVDFRGIVGNSKITTNSTTEGVWIVGVLPQLGVEYYFDNSFSVNGKAGAELYYQKQSGGDRIYEMAAPIAEVGLTYHW